MSADGRFVVFSSVAEDLVPGDTNRKQDVFLRDRQAGTTVRMSVGWNGAQSDGDSMDPSISSDGRFILFESSGTNLVPADTNHTFDDFVVDRQLGTIERVSVRSDGSECSGASYYPSISDDGRYVVFESCAPDLVPGDTNAAWDVFLRDRQTGTTVRLSIDSNGRQGDGDSHFPSITADGRYVTFDSTATNLVPGDANSSSDIFLRDLLSGTLERVSLPQGGAEGNGDSVFARMSADGRFVAFASSATNLVPGDTNGVRDVFVRDRQSSATERVSVDSGGVQGNARSYEPSISADGRFVTMTSDATNLVPGDTNGTYDVLLRDRQAGTTTLISANSGGTEANALSTDAAISADGGCVAFTSLAHNLAVGDNNSAFDVFVRIRFGGPSFTSLCDPSQDGVIFCPCSNAPGGTGRGCDNSDGTGGSVLSASGGTYLSSDSLVFTASGEKPAATSVLLQGTSLTSGGLVYGQGVRCFGGTLKRLFTKTALGGSITAPNFGAGDPTVSTRSAVRGSPISPGDSRFYLVFYRDPVVLGGCPASSTFNCTQTGMVTWSP